MSDDIQEENKILWAHWKVLPNLKPVILLVLQLFLPMEFKRLYK